MMKDTLVRFMEHPGFKFNALAPYESPEENQAYIALAVRETFKSVLRPYSFEAPVAGVPTVDSEDQLFAVLLNIGAVSHREGYLVPHKMYYNANLGDIRLSVAWQHLQSAAVNFGFEPIFDREYQTSFFYGREYWMGEVRFALAGRPRNAP